MLIDVQGRETDAVVADILVILGVGAAGHHVGAHTHAGIDLSDGPLHQPEGVSSVIHHRAGIVLVKHFGFQVEFLRHIGDEGDALIRGLMRDEAQVRRHISLLGKHVQAVRALRHGKGDGGVQHGRAGRADEGHELYEQGLKQPEVGKYQLHAEDHVGSQAAEHFQHRRAEPAGKGRFFLHRRHELSQPHQRRVPAGRGGMASLAAGGKFQVAVALFQHAHHGVGSLHAADGLVQDHAALVDEELQMDALLLQPGRRQRRALSAELLRAAAGDIHVSLRHEAFPQLFFHRGEDAEQTGLGIHGAAAPQPSLFIQLAGKGRMLPVAVRLHHVVVAHQKDRLRLPLPAPLEKKASVKHMLFTGLMHQREKLLQKLMKFIKFTFIRIKAAGDGLLSDHPRKPLSVLPRPVVILKLHLRRFGRRGLLHAGADEKHRRKKQDQD